MPPLPKKKKRKEADITPRILLWFKEHYPFTCALEIKVGNNKLLPHQDAALNEVARGTFSYKVPDDSRGRKPFDAFVLRGARAFVVRCEGRTCTADRIGEKESFEFSP